MATTTYPAVGNVARLSGAFTDENGDPADPTTVTVQILTPGNIETTETPIRDGAGLYHYDVTLTTPGTWQYRFIGTGAVVAQTADRSLYVNASFLAPG